uniref:Uncharacterized protein n=1 Tax=Trichogramma kaykai TaxID=54128 RepID=A0ABD2XE43_9HYME
MQKRTWKIERYWIKISFKKCPTMIQFHKMLFPRELLHTAQDAPHARKEQQQERHTRVLASHRCKARMQSSGERERERERERESKREKRLLASVSPAASGRVPSVIRCCESLCACHGSSSHSRLPPAM